MPSRLATSLTVKLCGGNSFFNTASFLSGEYRVTHSSLALCSINDDLMRVTTSLTQGAEEEALLALDQFCDRWDDKYPQISRSWRTHWQNLNTLFNYPEDIRKAIYTTNAIESLNSVIRKAIKKRKLFPTDDSAKKVIYLAVQAASKKWTMPIRNWKLALNRFMIEFEDRLAAYI